MPYANPEDAKAWRQKRYIEHRDHDDAVRAVWSASNKPAGSAYRSWEAMKRRCNNPKVWNYADYGGRGITYDPHWEKFDNFHADMGDRPVGTTLDRIDNDGPYSKENCKWSTQSEQNRNQRPRRHYK